MPRLHPAETERAMRLSVIEAGVWALMVGLAETYFVATAVHLGATPLHVGLAVALPLAVGSLGPLIALRTLSAAVARRPLAVGSVVLQALVLLLLSTLLWTDQLPIYGLIAGLCLYQMAGQAGGTAWASWYGDLVPAHIRGRWFSGRNRVVYVGTCVGLVSGGVLMQWIEPAGVGGERSRLGFALLFLLAAVFRVVSGVLLSRSPEPDFHGIPPRAHVVRFTRTRRGRQALRILLLGAGFQFLVYWGSPFFAPFMLEDLRLDYVQYMIASLCVIVAKATFTSQWGRIVDQQSARTAYLISMIGVALVPWPWVWAQGLTLVILAQVVSGAMWSGYEVGYLAMLLENSTSKTRPYVFASQSVLNGIMQIAGTVFGAQVVFPLVGGYREVFAASALGRMALVAVAPFVLAALVRGERVRWDEVGVRLFGLRAHGGFSVRPVLPAEDEPETTERPGR